MNVRPGQVIGEYRLLSFLGAGGMGDVYRAEHVRLGRAAVVKVLKHLDAGGASWQRFFNEARIQAGLNHPNIAVLYAYYDTGVTPCIVMEYVDGPTLDQYIAQYGGLAPATALAFFAKIVATVGYIHEQGIIHRDIKPNNIKINSQGAIKLLDFGISKAAFSQDLTAEGKCIGTDHYLAPEQLRGQPASVASDIWSLGALLYEMVTGKKAFEGGTWGELYKAISTASYTLPSLFAPAIPPDMERIIATCLKKNPAHRYRSAKALLADVSACDPASGRSGGRRIPVWTRLGFRPVWAALALVILAVVAGGAVLLFRDAPVVPSPPVAVATSSAKAAFSPPAAPATPPADPAVMRTVRIDVYGNPARVYLGTSRQPHGAVQATPYQASYARGTHLYFVLERPGYRNCVGEFTVRDSTEANNYTYQLCKAKEPCPPSGCK